jgi:hypothetical protein
MLMENTRMKIAKEIKEKIEQEFPGDPGLQQIHIARYLISQETKEKGLNLQEYIDHYYD